MYIKEAHPVDGWRMGVNDMAGIAFEQPKSTEERFGIADQCSQRLDMKTPVLVDDMDDSTCNNYAAFPDRLYIIDLEGKVVYKGGRGPFGYKPKELEQSLLLVMMDAQIKARQKAAAEKRAADKLAQAKALQQKLKEEKLAREKLANEKKAAMDRAEKRKQADLKDPAKSPRKKIRPEPPGPDSDATSPLKTPPTSKLSTPKSESSPREKESSQKTAPRKKLPRPAKRPRIG